MTVNRDPNKFVYQGFLLGKFSVHFLLGILFTIKTLKICHSELSCLFNKLLYIFYLPHTQSNYTAAVNF